MTGTGARAALLNALGTIVLFAGCTAPAIGPMADVGHSGTQDGNQAPTGLAPGVTLYFLDAQNHLRADVRDTGRLGTISEALALLLTGPGMDTRLHTGIDDVGVTRVQVTTGAGLVQLGLPLAFSEVTAAGIDQIVCTVIGVHVQSGGSKDIRVQTHFVIGPERQSTMKRTCPAP